MEPIRNEVFYMVTGEQLKQFANQIVAAFSDTQKRTDPIFLKKACSKSEAARYLGKNRVTIYNMIKDGRLKTSVDGKITVDSIYDYENGVTEKKECATNKRGRKVYV